ncbi:MAG: type II methionyl aminopeptidase [Candidatus Micrarchaeota archaeon]|nr:type II methionyl aminopeptidase [Candidatus Micrarchaeota archaeon]
MADNHEHHEHEEPDINVMKDVGKASVEAMLKAKQLIKPGAKLLDVADAAEKFLKEKGYGIAFPINLSINEQAAHYTPTLSDEKVFGDDDVVKIDFGAERDGILGDGALTVDLSGKYQKMVDAASAALDNAISTVRHGVTVRRIGAEIASTIEKAGFKPIRNLGGHGIHSHELHAELFIPNYDNGDDTVLEEGMTVAIEPFVTDGRGMVVDSDLIEIYSFAGTAAIRSPDARALMNEIAAKYPTEPFAARWLSNVIDSKFRLYAAVRELLRSGCLSPHPTLIEAGNGMVTQAEAELVVGKGGCEIVTKV